LLFDYFIGGENGVSPNATTLLDLMIYSKFWFYILVVKLISIYNKNIKHRQFGRLKRIWRG
jgi:hypothetical protein